MVQIVATSCFVENQDFPQFQFNFFAYSRDRKLTVDLTIGTYQDVVD